MEDGGEGGTLGHGQGREDQLLRDLIYVLHAEDIHARLHYIEIREEKEDLPGPLLGMKLVKLIPSFSLIILSRSRSCSFRWNM